MLASDPGRRAYTLIELAIVLLVLAIAAALTIPLFGNSNTTKLRAAANILAADIAYTQSESIAHGDDLRLLVINADHTGYRIATQSHPDTAITNPVNHEPYQVTFGQGDQRTLTGVTITATNLSSNNQLIFGALGQLDQTEPAVLTLSAGNSSLTVTVDPSTGQTTISNMH